MALSKIEGRSLDVGQLGNRNLIINGAMQVAQRGTSFAYANGYKLDRWLFDSYAGGSNTFAQDTDVPDEALRNSAKITATADMSDYYFYQKVEGFRQFSGKTVTFSFYAKASQNINGMQIHWSANTGSGGDFAFMTEVQTYDLTTDWQRYTFVITLPTFTQVEGAGAFFGIMLGIRQTYTTPQKGVDIPSGASVWFTGVQLEVGDTATPYEHRSYGQELALCQRYYQKFDGLSGVGLAMNRSYNNGNQYYGNMTLQQSMRSAPTLSTETNTYVWPSISYTTGTFYQRTSTEDWISFEVRPATDAGQYTYTLEFWQNDLFADAEL